MKDEEPKLWLTMLKLIVGATILIGGTGYLLWWAAQQQGGPQMPASKNNWGISRDSPIPSKR